MKFPSATLIPPKMADVLRVREQLSLVRSWLSLRRLDDRTLEFLQSILASGDVGCQYAIRWALRSILRGEISTILEENASKSVFEKLRVVEFFVCAFALAGDTEKCLAMRYEGLLLREDNGAKLPCLKSTYDEWISLAQDSLDNGFYSVAIKCCNSALSCIVCGDSLDPTSTNVCHSLKQRFDKVQQLRDAALVSSASHSVQAQAAEYLRMQSAKEPMTKEQVSDGGDGTAACKFWNGIKRRSILKFHATQFLQRYEP